MGVEPAKWNNEAKNVERVSNQPSGTLTLRMSTVHQGNQVEH